jgi:hypothetical protein
MREHDHLQPRHQRDYPRIFSFIKAHALLNCFNRDKVSQDTIMANQTDIDAGFELYKGIGQSNEMGLSPYILKIYDDVFMPILNPNRGVSRDEILKQYYKARHKSISPEVLRLEILPQLEAVGLIYQEEGERRKMLVYPTESHTYNKSIIVCVPDSGVKPEKSENDPTVPGDMYSLFWDTYEALENQKQSDNKVSELMLRQALISAGIDAGQATQTINDIVSSGKLQRLGYDVLCKKQ